MCVLNNGGDSGAAAPVVVEMRLFVRDDLHLVRSETVGVVNDVVGSWRDGALTNALADQVEVVAFWKRDGGVNDSSRCRVAKAISLFAKNARVEPFVDENEREFR